MAPILLKIKGHQPFTQAASLENEEELSKTWKICTKVKDSLENGSRLENLSWRLWHLHKMIVKDKERRRACLARVSSATTRKLDLDGRVETNPESVLQPIPNNIAPRVSSGSKTKTTNMQKTFDNQNHTKHLAPAIVPVMQDCSFHADEPIDTLEKFFQEALNDDMLDDSFASNLKLNQMDSVELAVQLDDFFGPLPAVAFLGNVEQGPWLELPQQDLDAIQSFNIGAQLQAYDPAISSAINSATVSTLNALRHPSSLSNLWSAPMPESTSVTPPLISSYRPNFDEIGDVRSMSVGDTSLRDSTSVRRDRVEGTHSITTVSSAGTFVSKSGHLSFQVKEKVSMKPRRPNDLTTGNSSRRMMASTEQQCANCGVRNTPLWRRTENNRVLCNACGLYHKCHNADRPLDLKSGNKKSVEELANTVCSNCQATTTPLWRKDEHGNTLCNACGLYYKMHGEKRPISMKSDVPRKRAREEIRRPVPNTTSFNTSHNTSITIDSSSSVATVPPLLQTQMH